MAEAEQDVSVFANRQVGEQQNVLLVFDVRKGLQRNIDVVTYTIHIDNDVGWILKRKPAFEKSDHTVVIVRDVNSPWENTISEVIVLIVQLGIHHRNSGHVHNFPY